VTNADLEKKVDTSDSWIITRTGIRERRKASRNQATSDLACEAASQALQASGVKAKDLDLILVATCTPDALMPSTACYLQNRLGARKAGALDLNAACTGFVYGLAVADSMIRSGTVENCLLVGAELLTRFLNWKDRGTCILFGDGAGAVILGPAGRSRSEVLTTRLYSDGEQAGLLTIPALGTRKPASPAVLEKSLNTVHMKGNETFKLAVKGMAQAAQSALKATGLSCDDIALFIPHQANIRIIEATAKRLKMPMSKVMVNIDRYGNTSAASIPIALDEAVRRRRIKRGDYVLMDAFGAGFTWGAALLRW
jgi:3-oxoacyl-[acyl-carrier-protein] synthase-3